MRLRKLIIGTLGTALLVAALPGAALAQDEATEPTGLSPEGVEWTLGTIAGEPVAQDLEVTLFLSGGEVVGNAGCNSYFGSYELDGAALTFPNPFGATRKLCEDPAMAVEDAYLPLLQETVAWAIDETGSLLLADTEGVDQLIYGEAPIDVTASDVDSLVTALEDLQAQIDEANAEVAALAAAAAEVNVNKFNKRLNGVEQSVGTLEGKVNGISSANLKKRIAASEKDIANLQKQIGNLTNRVKALETTDEGLKTRIKTLEQSSTDHEERIAAIEEIVPIPEQPLP